jgi:hypothetical protein
MAESGDDHPIAEPVAQGDFTLKKALFEIAIVAVGVLLALFVDQARQSRADRSLADEARRTMRTELDQNRIRIATKLSLLHNAYVQLDRDPSSGPRLVAEGANFQITLTDTAWQMALQTGAIRLLDERERQSLGYVYNSHEIYNRLLGEEMSHWTALAASPDAKSIKLWEAYARRVAVGGCVSSIRIERFRNPALPAEPLRRACQDYQVSIPPQQLYRQLGYPMPDATWRPGGEF